VCHSHTVSTTIVCTVLQAISGECIQQVRYMSKKNDVCLRKPLPLLCCSTITNKVPEATNVAPEDP